jgi:hypothetical protein
MYDTQDYWVSGLLPLSGILQNTTFRKPRLRPQEKWWETYTLLGPL